MTAAWTWLKANWRWLLFPIGVLLWLLGRQSAKRTVVLSSSALEQHAEVKAEAERKAHAEIVKAQEVRSAQLSEVEKEYDDAVDAVYTKAAEKAESLQGNPEAVNDFALSVGKRVRNQSKADR